MFFVPARTLAVIVFRLESAPGLSCVCLVVLALWRTFRQTCGSARFSPCLACLHFLHRLPHDGCYALRRKDLDAFDHDKRQRPAISGCRLHLYNFIQRVSPIFSRFSVQFPEEITPNSGENCLISGRREVHKILSRLWLSCSLGLDTAVFKIIAY